MIDPKTGTVTLYKLKGESVIDTLLRKFGNTWTDSSDPDLVSSACALVKGGMRPERIIDDGLIYRSGTTTIEDYLTWLGTGLLLRETRQ